MAEERRQSSYYTATTDCSDRGESAVDQHRHPNGFLQPRYEHQHMAASPSLSIPQPFQVPVICNIRQKEKLLVEG